MAFYIVMALLLSWLFGADFWNVTVMITLAAGCIREAVFVVSEVKR